MRRTSHPRQMRCLKLSLVDRGRCFTSKWPRQRRSRFAKASALRSLPSSPPTGCLSGAGQSSYQQPLSSPTARKFPPHIHSTDPDRIPFDLTSWSDDLLKPSFEPVDWGWPCIGGTRISMSQIDRFGPRYVIEFVISPPDACAGQMITIRGRQFGPTVEYFSISQIGDPAFALGDGDPDTLIGVVPKRWTDTRSMLSYQSGRQLAICTSTRSPVTRTRVPQSMCIDWGPAFCSVAAWLPSIR